MLEDEQQVCWQGGLSSSCGASWRWEETQPLSEPVDPDRQREEEPELSVAETQAAPVRSWSLLGHMTVYSGDVLNREQHGVCVCVCVHTQGGLAAGLMFLLIILSKGNDKGAVSGGRGGHGSAGGRGGGV